MRSVIALPPFRGYQTRALGELRTAVARARRRLRRDGVGVLAVAPTGAGKTLMALGVSAGALERGRSVLWLAPRAELVDQPVAKLASYGWHSVRVVKAGVSGDPHAPITVASIQTLVARDYAPPADIVIFDEARHYVAAEWGTIAAKYSNSIRIGLDATPIRADGSPLGDLFDELVQVATVRELQELWHQTEGREGLVQMGVWAPAGYQKELAEHPVKAWQKHAAGKKTIVFCQDVAHAAEVACDFRAAGIPAESVDGTTKASVRREALARLTRGDTLALMNCALFMEGLDLPSLEAVEIARGVAHEATWIQILGRALRPAEGKTRGLCLDLHGHVHLHGFPEDERTYSLDGLAVRRSGLLPSIVQCKSCHAWGRGGQACSMCGVPLPPPPRPRVRVSEMAEVRARAAAESEEQRRAWLVKHVAELVQDGANAWQAAHIFRARYGVTPARAWMLEAVSLASRAAPMEGTC